MDSESMSNLMGVHILQKYIFVIHYYVNLVKDLYNKIIINIVKD